MRSLLLLMIAASCNVYAASFTSVTCSAGPITQSKTDPFDSNCSSAYQHAFANASASASGGIGVVTARAEAISHPTSSLTSHADAQAMESETYISTGPNRLGLLQVTISLSFLHESVVDVLVTDGIREYRFAKDSAPVPPSSGFCAAEDCDYVGTLPFELGSQFQVSASATADVSNCFVGSVGCPFGLVYAPFSLFEANGTTPVPFSIMPEPSAWGLLLLGLTACTCAIVVQHKSKNSRCPSHRLAHRPL
jgi:hypothetical protein